MIPLASWLHAKSVVPEGSCSVAQDLAESGSGIAIETTDVAVGGGISVDHEAELVSALEAAEERLSQMAAKHIEEENNLQVRLNRELSDRLAADIARVFQELLSTLEESLSHVLTPFLHKSVRERAISKLLDMVRHELANRNTPVLEIRVPPDLDDIFTDLAEEFGIAVTRSRAGTVEVLLTEQRLQFRHLVAQWCAEIEGDAA